MKQHLKFLQGFIKNPMKVGAISPSSTELALKMIEDVEPDKENAVVEIGCGTGAITNFIENIVHDRKAFIGIEIDKEFVKNLEKDYPKLQFVCDDACRTGQILKENSIGKVSYIISGLPFVVLPKEVSKGILHEVDKLMNHGCLFRTFQYAHGYHLPPAVRFREELDKKYGKCERSDLIMRNVPPVYTLTWKSVGQVKG
jgi:phosphatidylethanolamine/phosphatidyl-N-methylethanolamine N-methyltransferase